jgi:hypothetical protein
MFDYIQRPRQHDLLLGVRRSVRYHARRRRFFDRLRKAITFLTVISGISTFAMLLSNQPPVWPVVTAALVTFFGIIDLILNTAEGARLHADLSRSFMDICPGEIRITPGRTPGSEIPRPATAA